MKKLTLGLIVLPLVICACSKSEDAMPATGSTPVATTGTATPPATGGALTNDKIVGMWKVDVAATSVPDMTADNKKEEEAMRMELKADGTFAVSGTKKPGTGTWKLDGTTLSMKSDTSGAAPPTFSVAEDGSTLTFSQTQGDKSAKIVFVKA